MGAPWVLAGLLLIELRPELVKINHLKVGAVTDTACFRVRRF
jgi:hypothetical protein